MVFSRWSLSSSKPSESTAVAVEAKPVEGHDPVATVDSMQAGDISALNGDASRHLSTDTVQPPAQPAAEPEVRPDIATTKESVAQLSSPAKVATEDQEKAKLKNASSAKSRTLFSLPSAEKRAYSSAVIVRELIVGLGATSTSSKPQLTKVKAQLMQPKSANAVIAQLRTLPTSDEKLRSQLAQRGPIHAVCLDAPDEEVSARHFAKLDEVRAAVATSAPSVTVSSVSKLSALFKDMKLVDLVASSAVEELKEPVIEMITSPDLGLGQPGDGKGILAGALPTAETVINGFEQITPSLMALGYATGKAVLPDHSRG